MNLYEGILFAGAVGTFIIIYQNLLSTQPTRVEMEDRLRERLVGKGDSNGQVTAEVTDLRVRHLSKRNKLEWYLKQGLESSTEVYITMNAELREKYWDAVESLMEERVDVEVLKTEQSQQTGMYRYAVRIGSVDESKIMQVVQVIPLVIDELDFKLSPVVDEHSLSMGQETGFGALFKE